jgi:hypothetical protein
MFSRKMNIDREKAVQNKIAVNGIKYPVDKTMGSAIKYS